MSVKTTVPVLIQLCCHNVYRIVAKSIIVFTTLSKKLFDFSNFLLCRSKFHEFIYFFDQKYFFNQSNLFYYDSMIIYHQFDI